MFSSLEFYTGWPLCNYTNFYWDLQSGKKLDLIRWINPANEICEVTTHPLKLSGFKLCFSQDSRLGSWMQHRESCVLQTCDELLHLWNPRLSKDRCSKTSGLWAMTSMWAVSEHFKNIYCEGRFFPRRQTAEQGWKMGRWLKNWERWQQKRGFCCLYMFEIVSSRAIWMCGLELFKELTLTCRKASYRHLVSGRTCSRQLHDINWDQIVARCQTCLSCACIRTDWWGLTAVREHHKDVGQRFSSKVGRHGAF